VNEIGALKAAVVGTGFIGVVHVDALRRLGIEVLGVVGSSPERARAKGIGSAYESLDAMLEDDRVDVVHLTTPNNLHYPQVKQALAYLERRAGKGGASSILFLPARGVSFDAWVNETQAVA